MIKFSIVRTVVKISMCIVKTDDEVNMKNKLLPCPRCGKAKINEFETSMFDGDHDLRKYYQVYCVCTTFALCFDRKEDAITSWNNYVSSKKETN